MPMPTTAVAAGSLARLLGDGWQERQTGAGPGGSAYRALAEGVRTLVGDGRVAVGSRLPAERELATALGVSRTTIAAAYQLLREEGFLTSRRGSGSYVALPEGRPMPSAGLSPFPTDGGGVIDLGVAAMSAPEPWLSAAMTEAVAELPAYTRTHGDFPAGLRVLREAVAARYEQRGLPTSAEEIMITSGAAGALNLLFRQLLRPGERVAVDSPSYANALQALRFNGARPLPVPLAPEGEDGGWSIRSWSDALRAAAPQLAYVIPDFHNPTGLLMPAGLRRELVRLARSTGTVLLADETMAEYPLEADGDGPPPLPLAAYDPGGSTVITVGSAGKTFWGGLRIGWIRAAPDLVRRLAADRASADVSSPVVEQLAVARLLGEPLPAVLRHQRERVRRQRDALVAAVRRELPGWTFRVPEGGLCLWVRTEDGESGSALAADAARYGLWLAAGPRFGVDGTLERFLRLPFTQPEAVAEEAVRRLARARGAGGGGGAEAPGAPVREPLVI
ncbi:MocR-like transcription factor YczR [Phaeacidiphilus oryzae]|uniref:MocR-like transcription factor YczR n=1 Tax=Phaeacidiphilus oryzae TaxID=348818 RepID=UPI0005677FE0